MKNKISFLIFGLLLVSLSVLKADDKKKIQKTHDDDNSKFTNVGNVGLTITNFGIYGHAFSKWPDQPSCEFPLGSGIEHIYDGGLWIGGFIADDTSGSNQSGPYVTTAVVDFASTATRGGGLEFTNSPGSLVKERSSLLTSKNFDPFAIAHQDLISDYTDTNVVLSNGEIIRDHVPLGVTVHQETYAWNYPFADFFVILNYWIKNTSDKYINDVYVGLWTDAVVRNTNVTSPRTGSSFFLKGGNGFIDSLNLAYEFDATGDVNLTNSYVGIQFLGASVPADEVNFVTWQYRNTSDVNFFAPQDDIERYRKLQGYFGGNNKFGSGIEPNSLKQPNNRSILISAGNLKSIAPNDSVNVVFAIVLAKQAGNEPQNLDTDEQKTNLYSNASWAKRAYDGEDKNGNGALDNGEDFNGDGKLTRYVLPSPPQPPFVKVIPQNQKISIYWSDNSERSIDPISGKKDFEGYRIYRTNPGFDLTESQNIINSAIKVSEIDSAGNSIGFNTGFLSVKLENPVTFPGDTVNYNYVYEVENQLNGWQYIYSVTAFDKGDPENNLESLESSLLSSLNKVIPGTTSTSDEDVEIGVYPNPYYGKAYWDGSSERLRKINFYNLPTECEITIYTLSGDIVKRIPHNSSSNGSDLRWFQTYSKDGTQRMSGGEHSWDLITDSDQAIATGMYLFTVKDFSNGKIKTGKFLIIK